MPKSFFDFLKLHEQPAPSPFPGGDVPPVAPPAAPPPSPGGLGGDPFGGGGLGGGPLASGGLGGDTSPQEPAPVNTVDVMDVWSVLGKALKDMSNYKELRVDYHGKKEEKNKHDNLSLIS